MRPDLAESASAKGLGERAALKGDDSATGDRTEPRRNMDRETWKRQEWETS